MASKANRTCSDAHPESQVLEAKEGRPEIKATLGQSETLFQKYTLEGKQKSSCMCAATLSSFRVTTPEP